MQEKKPVFTETTASLLEISDNRIEPIHAQSTLTIQLSAEFMMKMAFFCKHNPTQYPQ